MKNNCKEKLIEITIELINENNGDLDKVTIRDISNRSGVSIGLINYHFGNKNNLVTICTQRIIQNVITAFKPNISVEKNLDTYEASKVRLKHAASEVFYFLFNNQSICKLSILSDYCNYNDKSNSWASINGFSSIIGEGINSKALRERISFYLVNSMQVAFLKALTEPCFLGYDFRKGEERKKYIDDLVDRIM